MSLVGAEQTTFPGIFDFDLEPLCLFLGCQEAGGGVRVRCVCVCVCARARARVCVSELAFADWWVWGRNWEKEVVF